MGQEGLVKTGDPAILFSRKEQNDKIFGLYEENAGYILLYFHPLAWTEFCAAQMRSLEEHWDALVSSNCLSKKTRTTV